MIHSEKFIEKYMLIAKAVGTVHNPCYSRQIGVIIVRDNKILGTGYNGPPKGTPHCDNYDYLLNFFWPQLTTEEKKKLIPAYHKTCTDIDCANHKWDKELIGVDLDQFYALHFAAKNQNCKTCPRRLIGAGAGERSTLCSCQHAERNAITNAAQDLSGATMFCWCGIPCIDCTGAIVNSGIETVYYLDDGKPVYHSTSEFLFQEAKIELISWRESSETP